MLNKEELKKILKIKGNVRGVVFQSHANFIIKKEGEEGLEAFEKEMADLGHPLSLRKVNVGGWYPEFISILNVAVAKDMFHWTEKDIFEMGRDAPRYSFISKMLVAYFVSLRKFVTEVPKYWEKHFDTGELEVTELDEEKKYIILREKNHDAHPLVCIYHAGYYHRIAENIIKSNKITVEETGCVFRGDPYHEYIVKWE